MDELPLSFVLKQKDLDSMSVVQLLFDVPYLGCTVATGKELC